MTKLIPLLLLLGWTAAVWLFSAWRLKRELDRTSTPLDHPRLRPTLRRLAETLGLPEIRVRVHEVPVINGLAAPDGRVFLTRGFLDRLDRDEVTEAELASVMAHELGHVVHGHTRRRLLDFAGQNAIRSVLGGMLSRVVPGVGGWLAGLAASAFAARLSRQDEFEADAFAAALMIRAGYGTGPQKSLLAKLETLAGAARGTPAWLMSHPPVPQRIAAIERFEAGQQG
ncbi:M48 family metalloprotease [Paracoccus sp. S-4012]|uniref:M48 family metalloprotease n=1 Tax=Paracoccus sp. S-4012 TaxID=2665648 RepID=UPI0012AF2C69|nr:M48 family metalloprotease [Paracoccus sp. S-4012]MRX49624.1 M48 family metalloprotease [Paracoccus sp. S-4012]